MGRLQPLRALLQFLRILEIAQKHAVHQHLHTHCQLSFSDSVGVGIELRQNERFKKTVQMVTYAPYFISLVVVVGLLFQFLDPRTGIVNSFLGWFGVDPINFMGQAGMFQSIYVWSHVWQNVGFACIIYLAALAGIDPSLHEAAVMDGASKIQRMRHIDLPGIMPIAVILLILNTGQIMETGFEKILLMQNALNLRASEVIDTYVYKIGLVSQALNFSYATAIGLFKAMIGFVLLIVVNQTARKWGRKAYGKRTESLRSSRDPGIGRRPRLQHGQLHHADDRADPRAVSFGLRRKRFLQLQLCRPIGQGVAVASRTVS